MPHCYPRIAGLFAVLCAALLLAACSNEAKTENGAERAVKRIPVEAADVMRGSVSAYFNSTATLEAEQEAEVVARAEGIVQELRVEEGDRVSEGQILARLDRDRLARQVQQSAANLKKLETDHDRAKELYAQNLISAEEYQTIASDYEAQKAAHALNELQLSYTDIRAPISGVVSRRLIKVGNLIPVNQPVFTITDFDPLHAILYVPEQQIGLLAAGQRATITVDAHSGERFPGKVLRISPVVDPSTGTVRVTVEVKDESGRLKPGMFARVNIVHDVRDNALLIPKEAVMAEDAESAVFVVRDSLAFRRPVRTGFVDGRHIEVREGLDASDTVVITGQGGLKDSARVEIVTMTATADLPRQ